MKFFLRLVVLCMYLCFGQVIAQEVDSLISFDDVEFQSGAEDSAEWIEIPEHLEFSSSEDTILADVISSELINDDLGGEGNSQSQSLWGIFIAGVIGGFVAFLMPCIFPMVPLTVSFFTKKSASRAQGITQALLYGVFIIVIYVALGMLITIFFGAEALNALSTNGVFNFLFFLLLVVFAASFLGAFEITLPSRFVNKIDAGSDKGGLLGLFFMSASLAVVSFSCTGPIIGTLLVEAATKGERLGPAIGMLGFSLALAVPFVLFAMFPSMMQSLPKSGGWLNSVKVVLGFLELALALKFLSNVDLAYNWQFLDREVFLALWIVIFGLMGLYLIGKIRFAHDSPLQYLSVIRTSIAIVVFAFVVYLIPGMWGAPLKAVAAFLPPIGTQDFDLASHSGATGTVASADATSRKHYMHFHSRSTIKGLDPYYDYEEALEAARAQNKPLLVDFTGWTCVNCRKMEANVWSDPAVKNLINTEFILVELYVDEKDLKLPDSEQYISSSGKKIDNVGKRNTDFQITKFQSNSQPLYALLDHSEELLVPTRGADYDVSNYIEFLQSGLDAFKKR